MKKYVAGCVLSGYSAQDIVVDSYTPSLPKEYNCSEYLPGVLDQGDKPMCSAVAACTNLEFKAAMKNDGRPIDLSEEFIFDLRADKALEGMTARDTFDIVLKNGVPTYEAYKKNQDIEQSCKEHGIRYYGRIAQYEQISPCILNYGPTYIALPVGNEGNYFWTGKTYGYHAVAFVGWDEEGWILRNSWGNSWGVNGYVVFPYTMKEYIREAWIMV